MELIAARTLNYLYIYLDIIFLLFYAGMLLWQKRYVAFMAGLAGSLIYFIVDYGIYFLVLHTRVITGADPFWFLLWLSISYGFTNFAWIWIMLDRDGKTVEWSLLTVSGWTAIALLSQNYGAGFAQISIQRGTATYHGLLAFLMMAGYVYLVIRNFRSGPESRVNLLRLLIIGIGVQFSWELVLLISGIRPEGIMPLIVNSLVETNMGLPYLFLIHEAVSKRFSDIRQPLQA